MRARELVIALLLTACGSPDPRHRTLEMVQQDGRGGWIVVDRGQRATLGGELIAMTPDALQVLVDNQLVSVPRAEITSARLWPWPTGESSIALWGIGGTLSTLSHGVWLIASAPVWLLTTAVSSGVESQASVIDYPGDGWDKMTIWARFPQGLPAGVDARQLIHQDRPPVGQGSAAASPIDTP